MIMDNFPCMHNYTWFYNQLYNSNDFVIHTDSTLVECKNICDSNDSCNGINYLWDLKSCEILTNNYFSPSLLEFKQYNKFGFLMKSLNPCRDNSPFAYPPTLVLFLTLIMASGTLIMWKRTRKTIRQREHTPDDIEQPCITTIPPSYEESLSVQTRQEN